MSACGVVDDVTHIWDQVTDPIGAVVDTWDGFAAYFGEAHQRVQEAGQQAGQQWAEGDYLGALWTGVASAARENLWEAPWSAGGLVRSIADESVVDAWQNGDYGEAFGRGTWNLGQWFIPMPAGATASTTCCPRPLPPAVGMTGFPPSSAPTTRTGVARATATTMTTWRRPARAAAVSCPERWCCWPTAPTPPSRASKWAKRCGPSTRAPARRARARSPT